MLKNLNPTAVFLGLITLIMAILLSMFFHILPSDIAINMIVAILSLIAGHGITISSIGGEKNGN